MANRIEGITIEIGGDTTGLDKSLKTVNTTIRNTQSALKDVNRLLKIDPKNTELLAQKQRLFQQVIHDTSTKLDALRLATASDKMRTQLYTAVICVAERSFTLLPEDEPPIKKLYALPFVLFVGLSLLLNRSFNTPVHILPNFLHEKSTYCNS